MNIAKYLEDGSLISEIAEAKQIRSARAILSVVEKLRDERRMQNETVPRRDNENITRDYVFIAGMIAAYNQILSLPTEARNYINALPESQPTK